MAVGHLRKHDHACRHGPTEDRAVPAGHPRHHRCRYPRPCVGPTSRGHRPPNRDAFKEVTASQTLVLPRARPTTAETKNSTTAMKKIALAISMEAPAMPPKPRTPAMSAMIRKVTTQLNMTISDWSHFQHRRDAR